MLAMTISSAGQQRHPSLLNRRPDMKKQLRLRELSS